MKSHVANRVRWKTDQAQHEVNKALHALQAATDRETALRVFRESGGGGKVATLDLVKCKAVLAAAKAAMPKEVA